MYAYATKYMRNENILKQCHTNHVEKKNVKIVEQVLWLKESKIEREKKPKIKWNNDSTNNTRNKNKIFWMNFLFSGGKVVKDGFVKFIAVYSIFMQEIEKHQQQQSESIYREQKEKW